VVFLYTTALKVSLFDVTIHWDLNPCRLRASGASRSKVFCSLIMHCVTNKPLPFVYVEHAANWFPLTGPASCFGREWKSLLIQLWKSGPKRICKSFAKVSVCTFSTGIWDSWVPSQAVIWILWKAKSLFP